MLVISRRSNDKICFPNLGISVKVLRLRGNTVCLGIDAPDDVKVLRHELANCCASETLSTLLAGKSKELSHDLRNRFNTVGLALHLIQKQIEVGMVTKAEKTLQTALLEFNALDQELGDANSQSSNDTNADCQVLLVEDDSNERELLSGILRMNGFQVETAQDGLEAMGYLDKHDLPDVVLMDMRMPRLDGPKTVSAIRRTPNYSALKLFALSATDPGELGVGKGPNGVDRWFPKPLNPSSLVFELNSELKAELN